MNDDIKPHAVLFNADIKKEYLKLKENGKIKFSNDEYKNTIIEDIIKRIEKFDELSTEEINTMCNVLKSLKGK